MKNSELGTWIDGIISTCDLDSSGERIKIEGIDHSSVFEQKDAFFNWEHKNDTPSQVVGKIMFVKKILKKSDCENKRQEYYWKLNKERPYLYGYGVLWDKMDHSSAKDVAAIFSFSNVAKEENGKSDIGFSIEGSRLAKEGSIINKCILRSVAITQKPCNKSCIAEKMTQEDVDKYTKPIKKKSIEDSMKKSLEEEVDMKKGERKYYKELAEPKEPKAPSKPLVTQATGEHREGEPIVPQRTFTSTAAPEKIKIGDRIEYKKPKKGRDLYKDLENPIRKAFMKKTDMEKARVDEKLSEAGKKARRQRGNKWSKPLSIDVKGVHDPVNSRHDGMKEKDKKGNPVSGTSFRGKHERAGNRQERAKSNFRKLSDKVFGEDPVMRNVSRQTATRMSLENIKYNKENKPNLPKSEKNKILKSLANEAWDNFKHKDLLIETIKKKEPDFTDAEVMGIAKTFAYMDMKKKESEITDMFEKNKDGRCWDGYEPTPNKKPYSKGSCQPIKKAKGVHSESEAKGQSIAGKMYRDSKKTDRKVDANFLDSEAKDIHRQKLGEQKQMPKPNLPKSEEMSKEEFNFKADHKSDKGGLTEKGRKAYNKATGSNLKKPQPEGGKRKKSFCARNKGQIDMHNIDCKKDPEKRACKARKRWKC